MLNKAIYAWTATQYQFMKTLYFLKRLHPVKTLFHRTMGFIAVTKKSHVSLRGLELINLCSKLLRVQVTHAELIKTITNPNH